MGSDRSFRYFDTDNTVGVLVLSGERDLGRGVPMAHAIQPQFNCSICNKPVDLAIAKTDDDGKAVHDECYILNLAVKQPSRPINRPPAS